MVPINAEIRTALRKFIDDCGSQLDAERVTGIANTTFSKWMSDRAPRMQNSTWLVIEPFIRKYLPPRAGRTEASEAPAQEKVMLELFRTLNVLEQAEALLFVKRLSERSRRATPENRRPT